LTSGNYSGPFCCGERFAALGIYRSESDRSYLQSIATGSTRYRYAAQSALKKFSN